jgi:uncharacterized protein DUF3883
MAKTHKSPMLVLHGIWLNRYRGMDAGFYAGGFKWPAKHRFGAEMFNFLPVNGRCYGHVEVLKTSVRIENVGATKKAAKIGGVLVVWTAPDPSKRGRTIVGWYRNATVHRWRQKPTGMLKKARTSRGHVCTYQVEAAQSDCTLLPVEDRVLTIPPRKGGQKGLPGQKPVFYPAHQTAAIARKLEERIRKFISSGKAEPLSSGHKPHGSRQPDPERRREIEEAAIKVVSKHFKKRKYLVEDCQRDKCGYDLMATKGDAILCIEVKGRSGVDVIADFTINEYASIRREQAGKFADGSYRICIVTDALSESKGAKLHHFWYVRSPVEVNPSGETGQWRNVANSHVLNLAELVAARASLEK